MEIKHRFWLFCLPLCSIVFIIAVSNFLHDSGVWIFDEEVPHFVSSKSDRHNGHKVVSNESDFDVEGRNDIIIFLHIQKTSGLLFSYWMASRLNLTQPCTFKTESSRNIYRTKTKDKCKNRLGHIWSNNFLAVGWPCGTHADWTELNACVSNLWDRYEQPNPNRRFWYFTLLRSPVDRYISEWLHTSGGSNWKAARLACGGRMATRLEVPVCFGSWNWTGISLNKFMSCPYNLANNRQTRMLADLRLVNCYDTSYMSKDLREKIMLQSAKKNLLQMAMFGLTEYQRETQKMFEKTFRVTYKEERTQQSSQARGYIVTQEERENIVRLNHLDIELYKFAKRIFLERASELKS